MYQVKLFQGDRATKVVSGTTTVQVDSEEAARELVREAKESGGCFAAFIQKRIGEKYVLVDTL